MHHTMLRISNPEKSLKFYEDMLGFSLIHKCDFPEWEFSLYFLAHLPDETAAPVPGTPESERFLWSYPGTALELTHNWGTEKQSNSTYHNSNDPSDILEAAGLRGGFGHLAVNAPDVYGLCDKLEAQGVEFAKKPDDGRMKGLAFAYDPDRYWIEILGRSATYSQSNFCNFSQTMLRVKNADASLRFYRDLLQMSLVQSKHFGDGEGNFSLYFLASLSEDEAADMPDPDSAEADDFVRGLHNSVLELTHNHGSEGASGPVYHTGNTDPVGFGHTAFLVSDVYRTCAGLEEAGVAFQKKPDEGGMKGLAFALDPDGYRVEILKRGWSPNF